MKKKDDKNIDKISDDWEPDWMNPANDRRTPYTEEELDEFVEGFISSMSDVEKIQNMIEQDGIEKVKKLLKERFREQDERNMINMTVRGSVH
ncbi:MAG: hypothetical protein ACC707_17390 [Thiohalomonadales bacterium]